MGGFKKMKGKNKEIIIAHPLDKLWMLPNSCFEKNLSSSIFSLIDIYLQLWRKSTSPCFREKLGSQILPFETKNKNISCICIQEQNNCHFHLFWKR